MENVSDADVFQFGRREDSRAFPKNFLKDIWAKMFFSSVVEKSDVPFAKAPPRKGCSSDLRSRGAVRFFGELLFDEKGGFSSGGREECIFFGNSFLIKGDFFSLPTERSGALF